MAFAMYWPTFLKSLIRLDGMTHLWEDRQHTNKKYVHKNWTRTTFLHGHTFNKQVPFRFIPSMWQLSRLHQYIHIRIVITGKWFLFSIICLLVSSEKLIFLIFILFCCCLHLPFKCTFHLMVSNEQLVIRPIRIK